MPDSLSKTIPIWCSVVNRLLFPTYEDFHGLVYNEKLVSASEASQIENMLASFEAKAQNLHLNLDELRGKLDKPIKPIWISRSLDLTAETVVKPQEADHDQFYPLYLCMASLYQPDGTTEFTDFEYIQGAGDDAESWAHGLTPSMFWSNKDDLLDADEDKLPEMIKTLIHKTARGQCSENYFSIVPSNFLLIGAIAQTLQVPSQKDLVVICSPEMPSFVGKTSSPILHLKCRDGKIGSRDLRKQLFGLPSFVEGKSFEKIFVCCSTAKDHSIGIALALLVLFTNEEGTFCLNPVTDTQEISKTMIRQKLSWITASVPTASPSRATLNAVNSFLMKESD